MGRSSEVRRFKPFRKFRCDFCGRERDLARWIFRFVGRLAPGLGKTEMMKELAITEDGHPGFGEFARLLGAISEINAAQDADILPELHVAARLPRLFHIGLAELSDGLRLWEDNRRTNAFARAPSHRLFGQG